MTTEKRKSKSKTRSTSENNVELKKNNRELNSNTTGKNGDYVILRNQGIYTIYRKIISLSIFSALMAVFALMTASYFHGKDVPPRYIPLSEDGKMIPLIPLSEPNQSVGAINEFALQAVRKINRYDYYNWKEQITEAQAYFTPDGWNEYLQQFQAANTINAVLASRMVVSSEPTGDVRVVAQGRAPDADKTYVWKVEVPIKIMYMASTNAGDANSQTGVITLTIIRIPTTINPKGIGIRIYNFDTSKKK